MSGQPAEIDDWVAGGIVPRRDHSPTVDIALRNVRMSARLGSLPDRGFGKARDDMNVMLPDMKQFGAPDDTVGDDECWGLWPRDPASAEDRGIPGWANAWPSQLELSSAPNDSGAPGGAFVVGSVTKITLEALPVRNRKWASDGRFKKKPVSLHPALSLLPVGQPGVVIAGTEERSQEDLFFPSGSVLIAPWRDGSPELGNWVFDALGDNSLDFDRRAHLQSLMRVWKVPATCSNLYGTPGTRGLAIQMAIARGGFAGRATFADFPDTDTTTSSAQSLAGGSQHVGGAFHVGFGAGDQHNEATNPDGDHVGPLHLNPLAKWPVSPGQDAPFLFTSEIFGAADPPGTLYEAKLVIDPTGLHPTPCGPKQGWHRWQVRIPVHFPPPPTETFTSPSLDHFIHTIPAVDGGLMTLPQMDETFRTDPGLDQGFGTNSAENPDADQFGGGGPLTGGNDGPGTGGGPQIIPNPDDGPGGAIGGGQGPLIHLGGGNAGPKVIPSPDIDDGPVDGQTLVPFGLNFFQPLATGLPAAASAGRSARARFGQNLPVVGFLNEVAVPSFVFRPTNFDRKGVDYRYNMLWDETDAAKVYDTTPAVARLEAIGYQVGESWSRTSGRGSGRYTGGTARGGVWVLPPELGTEAIVDGRLPTTLSQTYFGLYKSRLAFGKPLVAGLPASGYVVRLDEDSNALLVDTVNATGGVGTTGQLWPPAGSGSPTAGAPSGYITGFGLTYNAGSPSLVDVASGRCRDSSNSYDICIGDPSVDYLTSGVGLNANDALVSAADLGGLTGGAQNTTYLAGDAVTWVPACDTGAVNPLPFLGARTLTGTCAIGAAVVGVNTATVTGTGTRFLTELAVGDVIGNAAMRAGGGSAYGASVVVAIASDTSCTIIRDLNGTGAVGGPLTMDVFENLTVQSGTAPSAKVTEYGVVPGGTNHVFWCCQPLNNGVNGTNKAVIFGQPAAAVTPTFPVVGALPSWIYLWARTKSDGTATLSWSTQRTTPYTPSTLSGYSFRRRIAVLPIHTDNFVPAFTQIDHGPERRYRYECSSGEYNWGIVSTTAGGGGWTRLACGYAVPPTSTRGEFRITAIRNGTARSIQFRPSGAGTATTLRSLNISSVNNAYNQVIVDMVTDHAQALDQQGTLGSGEWLLDAVGYVDKP